MGCEHFVFAEQSSIDTFVTPTKAIPVISAGLGGAAREVLDVRTTGACRSLYSRVLGAKPVSGSIVTYWWDEYISTLLKQFYTDMATSGAGPDYDHGFVPDDTADLGLISAQMIYESTFGESVLGAVITSIELAVATKQLAQLTFNIDAKDKTRSGDSGGETNWDSLGTACPALVDPSSMYPTEARPLAFYDGALYYGGTLSYSDTNNIITIGGSPTQLTKVLNATVTIDAGVDTDGFGIEEDPTRVEFAPGNREITVSLEVSWSDYSFTLYDIANAGTETTLHLTLLKDADLGAEVILPGVIFDPFSLPDVAGDQSKRTFTLTGKAKQVAIATGDAVDLDSNIIIRNTEATP